MTVEVGLLMMPSVLCAGLVATGSHSLDVCCVCLVVIDVVVTYVT